MITTEEIIDVADGIFEDVHDPDYRKWRRMSPSTLEHGNVTMAHLKAAWDGLPSESTDALEFGTATHCRLLEPARFKTEYVISERCSAETKDKKQCTRNGSMFNGTNWYCGQHAQGTEMPLGILSPDEAAAIEAIAKSVHAHPGVALLRQNGGCEVSLAWTDPGTGLKLKGRIDKWIPECRLPGDTKATPTILDLKSVRSASPRAIETAIETYGWQRRAAMYRHGIETLTGLRPDYFLVCVEKEPPYAVAVYQLDEQSLAGGNWEYHNLLALWANCLRTNKFPGYGEDIQSIGVPAWKARQYQESMVQK